MARLRWVFDQVYAYGLWLSRTEYESVTVANALFSIGYGLRLLLLHDFFSYVTDTAVVLLAQEVPVTPLGWSLIGGGLASLIAAYTLWRRFFILSLYFLLFLWLLLLLSFIPIGWTALHTLIAFYLSLFYAWITWRTRGLNSPASPS